MPNLVGIGNSQVPTNGMLGGLAYEDSSILYDVRGGRRNLLINGDMRINQRYGTSSSTEKDRVTIDRWRESNPGASNMSHQTVADAPYGFHNSEKMTMGNSNYSISSHQSMYFQQTIEASNVTQLGQGLSTAKNFTVSFWVKSTVTGKFSIAAGNSTTGGYTSGNTTRTFPTTYQINDANTWEYKTVTFPGDTGGTWQRSGSSGGLAVIFDIGSGSQHESTPGQWNGNDNYRVPGTSRLSAANSSWQITGVQLEEGNVATPFDYRPIALETHLCHRYFQRFQGAVGGGGGYGSPGDGAIATLANWTDTSAYGPIFMGTVMRYAPKLTGFAHVNYFSAGNTWAPGSTSQMYLAGSCRNRVEITLQGMSNMSQGNAGWLRIDNVSGYLDFDAEIS
tara:strand:- start:82 stop:1260 length:1179 start_codon:yes stop_codon:yes gene_type:complete